MDTDSNNDGAIDSLTDDPPDDPLFEETAPGKIIAKDGPRAEVILVVSSENALGPIQASLSTSGTGSIRVYASEAGGEPLDLSQSFTVGSEGSALPNTVWVEGIGVGSPELILSAADGSSGCSSSDTVIFTVVSMDLTVSDAGGNGDRSITSTVPPQTCIPELYVPQLELRTAAIEISAEIQPNTTITSSKTLWDVIDSDGKREFWGNFSENADTRPNPADGKGKKPNYCTSIIELFPYFPLSPTSYPCLHGESRSPERLRTRFSTKRLD